jgi:DNA-binding FadR family transcriptional regulator
MHVHRLRWSIDASAFTSFVSEDLIFFVAIFEHATNPVSVHCIRHALLDTIEDIVGLE